MTRAKEPYYQYLPYFNRSDGSPSWQWHFMMAAGNYKGRVALGANRIGKSEQGAYECALAVTGQHPARQFPESGVGWIIGLDNPMIRDIDRPMFERYLPSRFKTRFYKNDNIWICHGDGREWKIVFKSTEMGPEKFQGAKVSWAWVDEEPKRVELFSEMEARLVDLAGIWWVTATPVRGTAWLKALSERADVYRTFAGMRENPYIPIEEVEKFAITLPEEERATRIDGEYVVFGGCPVFGRKFLLPRLARIEELGIEPQEGILEVAA
ncbi:MAG: terminase family protein [Planctomycetaceae bacterium]|nr:terminase family protein [Planctomycetaceae bacterium]